MPKLSDPVIDPLVKLLVVGNSGTGKTGLLASLAKAGYKLRILDYDNKVAGGILPQLLTRAEMENIEFLPLRDKMKSGLTGPVIDGTPAAFSSGMKALDKWEDGTIPSKWGPEYVLVVDTLTFLAGAAYDWAKHMNPGAKEPRQWFYTAQEMVLDFLANLTQDAFGTNVIVNAHITYQAIAEGTTKGFPTSIGKAIAPKIPAYFEHLGVIDGKQVSFLPTPMIDAKTPLLTLTQKLPRETALATFFESARKKA